MSASTIVFSAVRLPKEIAPPPASPGAPSLPAPVAPAPVPGPLLAPLYGLRSLVLGTEFRYDMNAGRFHYGNVLDGRRALRLLGYEPRFPVFFPAAMMAA